MLSSLYRAVKPLQNIRSISKSVILREVKPSGTTSVKDEVLSAHKTLPSEFDKKLLVWTKKYPNIESIPNKVSLEVMQNAHSKARIRVCNYMMIITLMGCAYVIISGKQRAHEETKNLEIAHDDMRRQITQEFKATLSKDGAK